MSMTTNWAFFMEITLSIKILAVVSPAVLVDFSPGYSIWSPPTVNRVLSFSSLWSLMSTTNDPYVTFLPFGMSDLRINRIVFVLYNLFISFAVDLIQLFLYFSLVMSFWCLRDFPVSGQITSFAISGEKAMGDVVFDERHHVEFAEREKQ
jgi:hypothetical protein